MMVPTEISLLVSSDPAAGAVRRTPDGSYFEVDLSQDPLTIPSEALSVQMTCESSTVWWVSPNITTANNTLYITGGSGVPETTEKTAMDYSAGSYYNMTILSTETKDNLLLIFPAVPDNDLPVGAFQVGDTFRPNTGISAGLLYVITSVNIDTTVEQNYNVFGLLEENILSTSDSFSRIVNNPIDNYNVVIPTGLYDVSGLNNAIQTGLENLGARTTPYPLLSVSGDDSTNRVVMRFNYNDVSCEFKSNSPYAIMGFLENTTYGVYPTAPINIMADNVAAFNQINYFMIHSDLTNEGIRFNNTYNQAIAQVLIDVAPGQQIVSTPFNPPKLSVDFLAGTRKQTIRMWLTDDQNRRVNTNTEYWSARIRITYLLPYFLEDMADRQRRAR